MNRSALVIKMLNYLYANGRKKPVSREDLAEVLETNVRNIVEFKKELEVAGYLIESVRGKDGGYILNEKGVFPSLALSEEEKQSVEKALAYLKKQSNFDEVSTFEKAMDKLRAHIPQTSVQNTTFYLEESRKRLNVEERKMLDQLQNAITTQNEVMFEYQKGTSKIFEIRKIRPYEIVANSDGYYVLAYDLTPRKKHAMKIFKITMTRMQNVDILKQHFIRDEDFKLSTYIGEYSLMKDEYEVELCISGLAARLVDEQQIENTISKKWIDDTLYVHFLMEGKYRVKSFILSLGCQCEVISPAFIKEEIKEELKAALTLYEK